MFIEHKLLGGAGGLLALVTSEAEYDALCDHLELPMRQRGQWIEDNYSAQVTMMEGSEHVTVVALRLAGRSELAVTLSLVHEAVHVFQRYCQRIGEHNPSIEFEAYAIEHIFDVLHAEVAKRLQEKPNASHQHKAQAGDPAQPTSREADAGDPPRKAVHVPRKKPARRAPPAR